MCACDLRALGWERGWGQELGLGPFLSTEGRPVLREHRAENIQEAKIGLRSAGVIDSGFQA